MKKNSCFSLLVLLLIISSLLIVSHSKKISILENGNYDLQNQLDKSIFSKSKLQSEYQEISADLIKTKDYIEELETFLDYELRTEVSNSYVYNLKSDMNNVKFIQKISLEDNTASILFSDDKIYDFIVSNNDEIIAVLNFDKINFHEQELIVFNNSGTQLYTYNINEFLGKIDNTKYDGDELITFDGFSINNEYLFGRLTHELDSAITFTVNLNTGELNFYYSLKLDCQH